jgi:hypothetical protein
MTMVLNVGVIMSKGQSIDIADRVGLKYSLLKGFLTLISAGIFTQVQFYLPLPVMHTISTVKAMLPF